MLKIIILALLLLYTLLTFVMGIVLITTIVNAKGTDREGIERFERMKIDPDYDNKWDRHPFAMESGGVTIQGEYILNPDSDPGRKKVVILCHGFLGNRFSDIKYARIFYDMGFQLVLFDQRHFGESGGAHCTLGQEESRDIANLIRYTRTIFGEDAFLGLHGESMGAASELLALNHADRAPDFVVADCPFADSKRLLTYQAKTKVSALFASPAVFFAHLLGKLWNYDFYKVNPIEAVERTSVPICLIHGADDAFIPCEHSVKMKAMAGNPASELHLIPGAVHAKSLYTDPAGYKKIVSDFIGKIPASQS